MTDEMVNASINGPIDAHKSGNQSNITLERGTLFRVVPGFQPRFQPTGFQPVAIESQTGPAMLNWFVAGHELPTDHWYFKPEEGGRVLGNLCHWTDFIYQMVAPENRYPITIKPTRWEKSDCDIAVTYIFGDGTIAAITFSAKGHTFEGVRERFAAHRENVLISMDDFQYLTVEVIDRKHKISQWSRDHGHEQAIKQSYENARSRQPEQGCSISYVWETGELFLKTREALESNETVVVYPFDSSRLNNKLRGSATQGNRIKISL